MEALAEVGEAISSTLDPDEVLTTIVEHAVELSGADGGSLMEYDEETPALPGPHRLRHEPATCWSASSRSRIHVDESLRGPGGHVRPGRAGRRPRRDRARPAPAGPVRRGLALARGDPARAVRPDRGGPGGAPADAPAPSATRPATCSRAFASQSADRPDQRTALPAARAAEPRARRRRASTSPTSSRACRTSSAPRSTRSSASRRCCSSGCSGSSTSARPTTCRTSSTPGATSSPCSTTCSTCRRSRRAAWSWRSRPSRPGTRSRACSRWCASAPVQHGVELRFDAADAPTHITADELRLKQVLLNLHRQRRQVHPGGRDRHGAGLDRRAPRCSITVDRHGHRHRGRPTGPASSTPSSRARGRRRARRAPGWA